MSEASHCDRRRFIGTAVTAIASAGLLASAQRGNNSPGTIRQIDARTLDVRYAESGPANGPSIFLLHGGSGGIDTDAARMAAKRYRVIVPYVTDAPADLIALMTALKIEKALVSGLGESARAGDVIAALWPQRLKAVAPVSGSSVITLAAAQRPLPPKEELAWWYQYYLIRNGEA
jgi:pimeloyl-ACP methyl ester carboxylesterase